MKVLKENKGERGVATILVVGVLVVFLIFFLVVAIDFAYIYVVRGQVQNAADAAAIAGTDLINDPTDTVQTTARAEAIKFAAKNSAAGESVVVVTNNSNVLSGSNDITVGFWNGSAYSRGTQPVNAMEVRPRRTQGSPGGPVGLFFGRLIDWPEMEVSRIAVATRPPTPTSATSVCVDVCSPGLELPAYFVFKEKKVPVPDPEKTVAFTEFSCSKATEFGPDSLIARLIRGEVDIPNVCDQCITTNNAAPQQIMKVLLDEYDRQKDADGNWSVVIPVVDKIGASFCPNCAKVPNPGVEACPTGDQPDEPFLVVQYATIIINGVNLQPDPGINIVSIDCTECPALDMLGRRAKLVR